LGDPPSRSSIGYAYGASVDDSVVGGGSFRLWTDFCAMQQPLNTKGESYRLKEERKAGLLNPAKRSRTPEPATD